jgi:AcrR family transcriptional regulator
VTRVSSPLELDGRTARRRRNTDAVLDAVHELFVEGHLFPTVEDVAARSGLSLRSIYRYFPDRDELLQAALGRRMQVAEPLFHLVDHRLDLYELMAPTARVALQAAYTAPVIAEVVRHRRAQLTAQTRVQFAPELDALPNDAAADLLAAVDVLCQFEAIESLRVERELSPDRSRRVLVRALRALLTSELG